MRKLVVIFACTAALPLAALTPSALAAPTGSQITSPSGTAYVFGDYGSSHQSFTVSGTTTGGTGNVDLVCFYPTTSELLKQNIAVTGGSFSTSVSRDEVASNLLTQPCTLRAVPTGDPTARPPSASSDPFGGPTVAPTFESETTDTGGTGGTEDFQLASSGGSGEFQFQSAWAGIWDARLATHGSLTLSPTLYNVGSGFNGGDLINIDGSDAFLPASISPQAGWQSISDIDVRVDPFTGALTARDREPVLTYVGSTGVPTGVTLERTWVTGRDGRVASLVDRWVSTDGQSHHLKVRYQDEVDGASGEGSVDWGDGTGFHVWPTLNGTHGLQHGPASLLFKYDKDMPDGGDGTNPQGAFTYSAAPDGPAKVFQYYTNAGVTYRGFELPYDRTVPADGALAFRFSYSLAYTLADVRSFAADAESGTHPFVSIGAPVDGASSAAATVTVKGTASDTAGTPSLTVNGQATPVAADGSWSHQVTLSPGVNTITAQAVDADGNTGSRSISVSYTPPAQQPPPPAPPAPPVTPAAPKAAKLSLVGAITRTKKGVSFHLHCANQACSGTALLRTTVKHKRVTIGRAKFKIAAGATKTVALTLNAKGRKLLKHHKRIHSTVTAALATTKPVTARMTLGR